MRAPDGTSAYRAAFHWLPVAGWMTVIFWFSTLSGTGLPSGLSSPAHFGVYSILGALCVIAQRRGTRPLRAAALAVLISSTYGVTDEIHQSFVPGRMPDVADWGFDTLGALAGALVLLAVWHTLSRRPPRDQG